MTGLIAVGNSEGNVGRCDARVLRGQSSQMRLHLSWLQAWGWSSGRPGEHRRGHGQGSELHRELRTSLEAMEGDRFTLEARVPIRVARGIG